jgi:hypothetical protein
MMKKLLLSATLATAVLASTPLLADPAGHRQGQNAPCTGANCPAATATGEHGRHGMGHGGMRGKMQAMHGEHQGKGAHGMQGEQRGKAGEGCPMHSERKPT